MPVDLKLTARLDLPKLKVGIKELGIKLADLSMNITGDIEADGEEIDIEELNINVDVPDLFALPDRLPEKLMEGRELPEGLEGKLPFKLACSLKDSYNLNIKSINEISLKDLPPVTANINISNRFVIYVYIYFVQKYNNFAELPNNFHEK